MKKVFIIPIILFLNFVFAVYFLFPRYSNYLNLRKQTAQLMAEVQKRENEALNAQQMADKLNSYKETVDKINAALPNGLSFASLLNFFGKSAKESGVILSSFNPDIAANNESAKQNKGNIKESYFNLSLKGLFPSFVSFVKLLENSSRMIEIENISLKRTKEFSSSKIGTFLNINLLIKVHYY